MNSIFEIQVSAEVTRMSTSLIVFIFLIILSGIAFVIIKMAIPVLSTRPLNWLALLPSLILITTLAWTGTSLFIKYRNPQPLVITLYNNGVKFQDSNQPVPFHLIQVGYGNLEAFHVIDGSATSIPIDKGLVFKIDQMDQYFKIGFSQSLSPQYNEKGLVKFPIGDKGFSEKQVSEFITEFNRLKASSNK